MSDIKSLLKMLQKNDLNMHLYAYEALRISRQPLPREAIDALNQKIHIKARFVLVESMSTSRVQKATN